MKITVRKGFMAHGKSYIGVDLLPAIYVAVSGKPLLPPEVKCVTLYLSWLMFYVAIDIITKV